MRFQVHGLTIEQLAEFHRTKVWPAHVPKPTPLQLAAASSAPRGDGRPRLIVVPGAAVGKPRMTQRDTWKKRPCVVRYRSWADVARLVAGRLPPATSIERLDWTAYFAPPPSWSKTKRAAALGELHRARPDRDNIDKAVLDALFASDAAIAQGTICKRWGEPPRLEITITETAKP